MPKWSSYFNIMKINQAGYVIQNSDQLAIWIFFFIPSKQDFKNLSLHFWISWENELSASVCLTE